jgi:lipoyl-dependent peroxiredoxin
MPTSSAEAVWEGVLRSGRGRFKAGSGAFEGDYSFATRFEGARGTNPEELIAAAHAACLSMVRRAGEGGDASYPDHHPRGLHRGEGG